MHAKEKQNFSEYIEKEVIFKDDLLEVLGERPWGERNVETQPIAE